ncbi:sensor histidine kinase [Streptomyces tubbatahanensis]|uniref:Sensor histidine kinase n=1 Tax=Streptomyces tubbatahanensis TaxID=2923272 RepID=A0ABY3XWM0_9ACTN|nr:sensor histidine kinase [Streptomyces tubbatahanensis]UNS98785.1 sensor histidine kinase [Streptomyces tubbatahanensis]
MARTAEGAHAVSGAAAGEGGGAPSEGGGRLVAVAEPPATRRQQLRKALMILVWMVFLGGPLTDLCSGRLGTGATVWGSAMLAVFVAVYAGLVFRHTSSPLPSRTVHALVALLFALACALSLTVGQGWLVLFVYVAVASGAVLPVARAAWSVGACVLALAVIGTGFGARPWWGPWTAFVVPAVLGGFALMSARKTVRTLRELRRARAAVAELAASEERLRLARDLHDLLGHSLSLVTLKSELAGRMLPAHPERAAEQIADIERVSRQALVDVREAVSGYRRPTLAVELAGARTALDTAGITAELPHGAPSLPLASATEGALAWALREAVTNVVRHSGARRCTVAFGTGEAATLHLTVSDDGKGPSGAGAGNGLNGLRERLALVDGSLSTSAGPGGGFTLRATVPSLP